jgi:hypothetical protein
MSRWSWPGPKAASVAKPTGCVFREIVRDGGAVRDLRRHGERMRAAAAQDPKRRRMRIGANFEELLKSRGRGDSMRRRDDQDCPARLGRNLWEVSTTWKAIKKSARKRSQVGKVQMRSSVVPSR